MSITKDTSRIMTSLVWTPRTFCPEIISFWEYQMEGNEQRWIAVGATRAGQILNIVFAVRAEAIRPITGWAADNETAALYLEEWGGNKRG
jgi:uncharacterized DUF497 family protein